MHKLIGILKNKYLLVFVFAVVWLSFLDTYNLRGQYKVAAQIDQLQKDLIHYKRATAQIDREREQLSSKMDELEKVAREKYLMSKKNEDIFIIVDE